MKQIINKNKGFTLVELMITVTVIGILTAIAVPAYQDYAIKAQVAEGLSLASGGKVVVAEYYSNLGVFPTNNEDAGYPSAIGKYVVGVTINQKNDKVAINSIFAGNNVNKKLNGTTISLVAEKDNSGTLIWHCESTISQKYLPNSCSYVQNGLTPEEMQYILDKFPDPIEISYPFVYGNDALYLFDQDQYFLSSKYDPNDNASLTYTLTNRETGEVQTFRLEPTGIDENGRVVYESEEGLNFGGEIISTVKLRKDEDRGHNWIDAYKKDPNDPDKLIKIRSTRG